MNAGDCLSVYVLFADRAEAQRIGELAVTRNLAACVNILAPCTSIFRWQGDVQTATEVPALFKTTATRSDALIDCIRAEHSYEVPAILAWPWAKASTDMLRWVQEALGSGVAK